MLYTPNISSYSKITEQINNLYANKYQYDFKVFKDRLANDRAPQWDKIQAILSLMSDSKYDYILWIDSDAYFNDHNSKIDNIFNINSEYNIHISSDKPYGVFHVNTGIILVKNNEWSKMFLNKIWECDQKEYLQKHYHEQTIFHILYEQNFMDSQKFVKIYNSGIFNQIDPRKPSYITHLMQAKENYRIYYAINKLASLTNLQ